MLYFTITVITRILPLHILLKHSIFIRSLYNSKPFFTKDTSGFVINHFASSNIYFEMIFFRSPAKIQLYSRKLLHPCTKLSSFIHIRKSKSNLQMGIIIATAIALMDSGATYKKSARYRHNLKQQTLIKPRLLMLKLCECLAPCSNHTITYNCGPECYNIRNEPFYRKHQNKL